MTHRRGLLLTLFLSLLFLAALEWRDSYFFQTDDNSDHFLPWYALNHRILRDTGEFAIVNWHQYLGQPHFSHGVTGVLYLPNYFFSWLAMDVLGDPLALVDWLVIAHLAGGTVLLYLLLRAHEVPPPTATAGALCGLTLPFVIGVSRIWLSLSLNFFYLAFSFLCLKRIEGETWRRHLALYAASRALFLLHGNVQYVAYTMLCEFVFLATHILSRQPRGPRVFLAWLVGNAAAVLIGLPVLWEMWKAQQLSMRSDALEPEVAMNLTVPLGAFLRAQAGCFESFVMDFDSRIAFIGMGGVALGLGWMAIRRGAWRNSLPWMITAFFALALALGFVSVFSLPLFDRFRWPFKFLFYTGWFATAGVTIATARLELWGAWRKPLAPVVLGLVALLQASLNFSDANIGAFAKRRVRDLNSLLADRIPRQQRVAAVGLDDIDACNLFTYNYATLTGHFSVGGYDPIISEAQLKAADNSSYTGIIHGALNARRIDWLALRGVAYVFVARRAVDVEKLNTTENLKLHFSDGEWLVYRFERTFPMAYVVGPDGQVRGVPLRFRGNVIDVAVPAGTGRVWLNIFPQPNLRYRRNLGPWRPLDAQDERPFVPMESEAGRIEIRPDLPSLAWTVPVSLAALLGCVVFTLADRRSTKGASCGSD